MAVAIRSTPALTAGRRLILGEDAEFGRWHWVRLAGLKLTPGPLRVVISNREDGIAIDKFLLTSDESFQPQGRWELVFTRDLSQPTLAGWAAPEGSMWVVSKVTGVAGRYLPSGKGSERDYYLLAGAGRLRRRAG